MIFQIKPKHLAGFKIWLVLLGYHKKDLSDGGATFKGKGTKLDYVFISNNLTGNAACKTLYDEYVMHLRCPDYLDVKVA